MRQDYPSKGEYQAATEPASTGTVKLQAVDDTRLSSLNEGVVLALGDVDTCLNLPVIVNEVRAIPDIELDSLARMRKALELQRSGREISIFRTARGVQLTESDRELERTSLCEAILKVQDLARALKYGFEKGDFRKAIDFTLFSDIAAFEEQIMLITRCLPRDLSSGSALGKYVRILKDALNILSTRIDYDARMPERQRDSICIKVFITFIGSERNNIRSGMAALKEDLLKKRDANESYNVILNRVRAASNYISGYQQLLCRHFGFNMLQNAYRWLEQAESGLTVLLGGVPLDEMTKKRTLTSLVEATRGFMDVPFETKLSELYQRGYFLTENPAATASAGSA